MVIPGGLDPLIVEAVAGWVPEPEADAEPEPATEGEQPDALKPDAEKADGDPAADPAADPEQDKAKDQDPEKEVDHAKARKRAEFLQRRARKLERLESEIKTREARVTDIERQITHDDPAVVFQAIARMRRTDPAKFVREALAAISGQPVQPQPSEEIAQLRAELQELKQAKQRQATEDNTAQLKAAWERDVASGIERFDYLRGSDPAEIVSEAWDLAVKEYQAAVRQYGAHAVREPTAEDVLQSLNAKYRKVAERFGARTVPETPKPARSAPADKPGRVAPPTAQQTAVSAAQRATPQTHEEWVAFAAAALDSE